MPPEGSNGQTGADDNVRVHNRHTNITGVKIIAATRMLPSLIADGCKSFITFFMNEEYMSGCPLYRKTPLPAVLD